jgi:hypothetical protein
MEPRVSILNFASNSDAMQMQICKQASVEKLPCCPQPFRHAERNCGRHSAAVATVIKLTAAIVRAGRNADITSLPFFSLLMGRSNSTPSFSISSYLRSCPLKRNHK